MKFIENTDTWNLMLKSIEMVLREEPIITSSDFLKLSKEELESKCKELATYSYQKDIETKQVNELGLEQRIRKGELFNSHLFTRLAKHFYLEEHIEGKECKKHRELVQALHWFLGNSYYYKADAEVMKGLCKMSRAYLQVCENKHFHNMLPQDVFLERYIEAALYLKSKGIDIHVKEGEGISVHVW